jgi:hypothetical protein
VRAGLFAIAVVVTFVLAGCGGQSAEEALRAAKTESAAIKALHRLMDEDGGDVLAGAFCTGATTYIENGKAPSGGDWAAFILGRAGLGVAKVTEKADQLGAILDLAQTNSSAATTYINACLKR